VDLYKHPLIEESLEAIMKLTEMKKEKKIEGPEMTTRGG
jgi:hypothetical protein